MNFYKFNKKQNANVLYLADFALSFQGTSEFVEKYFILFLFIYFFRKVF